MVRAMVRAIEELRGRLHELIEDDHVALSNKDVYQLSRELDQLINRCIVRHRWATGKHIS